MFNPKPDVLYLCDNGACYCGSHLGASAAATGRDISGQRIQELTPADRIDAAATLGVTFRCEKPRCDA